MDGIRYRLSAKRVGQLRPSYFPASASAFARKNYAHCSSLFFFAMFSEARST
jgi:hypothetical protein